MERPASQNERVGVLRMVHRARKVFGTFEKRASGRSLNSWISRLCASPRLDSPSLNFPHRQLGVGLFFFKKTIKSDKTIRYK